MRLRISSFFTSLIFDPSIPIPRQSNSSTEQYRNAIQNPSEDVAELDWGTIMVNLYSRCEELNPFADEIMD